MARKKNIKQTRKMFRDIAKEAMPDPRVFKKYADIVKFEYRRQFQTGVGPDGKSWKRLKVKTVMRKKKKGSIAPSKPLLDKGILSNPTTGSSKRYGYVRMPKSREKIFKYHNEGEGKNPVRFHWAISPEAIRIIERMHNKAFFDMVKKEAR